MRAAPLCLVIFAVAALGGCGKPTSATIATPHGRYAGIGIYQADRTWSKMSAAPKAVDKETATVADDQAVIVVVDSDTGEVRQCGNISGYCVGMNPWAGRLAASRAMPLRVSEHAPEKTYETKPAPAETSNETAPPS